MNKVQIDKSCGAVVFTIDGEEIKYILVEEACGFFSLPKGHVENDEDRTDPRDGSPYVLEFNEIALS